jgi:hypothetical protein
VATQNLQRPIAYLASLNLRISCPYSLRRCLPRPLTQSSPLHLSLCQYPAFPAPPWNEQSGGFFVYSPLHYFYSGVWNCFQPFASAIGVGDSAFEDKLFGLQLFFSVSTSVAKLVDFYSIHTKGYPFFLEILRYKNFTLIDANVLR